MPPRRSPESNDSSVIIVDGNNTSDKPATVDEEEQQIWDRIAKQDEERRMNDRLFIQQLESQGNSRDMPLKLGNADLTIRTESPAPIAPRPSSLKQRQSEKARDRRLTSNDGPSDPCTPESADPSTQVTAVIQENMFKDVSDAWHSSTADDTAQRRPGVRRSLNLKRRKSVDSSDGAPLDLADNRNSASAEPVRHVQRRLKQARPGSLRKISQEKESKTAEPAPATNRDLLPTKTEDIPPKQEPIYTNTKASDINLRVQTSLAAIQPHLASLGGTKVTAKAQERRMHVLVDLLCAVNEAGSDTDQVRKSLLRTMQQCKTDPPLQNSIFEAFAVCLGLR